MAKESASIRSHGKSRNQYAPILRGLSEAMLATARFNGRMMHLHHAPRANDGGAFLFFA